MTTAAAAPEPVFDDTNVLVYAAVPAFPLHADARTRLTELETAGVRLWISRQTLREYLPALSRPSTYSPPIPMTTLIGDVIAPLSLSSGGRRSNSDFRPADHPCDGALRREAGVRCQHRRDHDDSKHKATPHPQRRRLCSVLDLGRHPPAGCSSLKEVIGGSGGGMGLQSFPLREWMALSLPCVPPDSRHLTSLSPSPQPHAQRHDNRLDILGERGGPGAAVEGFDTFVAAFFEHAHRGDVADHIVGISGHP